MSVRPVTFNPDGSIEVVFDESSHTGTIPADAVKWTQNMDGTDNHNFIVLECPDGCGSTSTHPVGGGAAPPEVQEMFVRKIDSEGCPCGEVLPPTSRAAGSPDAMAHTKELVEAMDGPGRWQVDESALSAALSARKG
jgi:hypothetical protein